MKRIVREEGAMKRIWELMLVTLLSVGPSAGCTTMGIGTHAERGAGERTCGSRKNRGHMRLTKDPSHFSARNLGDDKQAGCPEDDEDET